MRLLGLLALTAVGTLLAATHTDASSPPPAEFAESLLVRPLHDGKVLLHFQFELTESPPSQRHFTLFPRPLGELLSSYAVDSFGLSLSSGRWITEAWGHMDWKEPTPPTAAATGTIASRSDAAPTVHHSPHGAELWAVFDEQTSSYDDAPLASSLLNATAVATLDSRWRNLQASLSGLFCASLSQMTAGCSSDPREVFPQRAPAASASSSASQQKAGGGAFRYATLPRESVCTENLSPFVKMLPCRTRRGLAGLLDPLQVYQSNYHAIQVRAQAKRGADGTVVGYALTQSVSVVLHPLLTSKAAGWSISDMLGVGGSTADGLSGGQICACSLSTRAKLFVHLSTPFLLAHDRCGPEAAFTTTPSMQPSGTANDTGVTTRTYPGMKDRLIVYDLKSLHLSGKGNASSSSPSSPFCPQGGMDYALRFPDTPTSKAARRTPLAALALPLQPLAITRYLSASTLTSGILHVHISNPALALATAGGGGEREGAREVQLFDALPWFWRVRLSTMRITVAPTGEDVGARAIEERGLLVAKRYTPAVHRGEPAQWFLHFLLPAGSTMVFSIEFDKSLLTANEYPPDVSRGFDIGSAIVRERRHHNRTTTTTTSGGKKDTHVTPSPADDIAWTLSYTPSLLVLMPFPDFSMPFNVIAFTSTILATFFGSLLNMTYARTEEVLKRKREYEEDQPTIVEKVKKLLGGGGRKKAQPNATAMTTENASSSDSSATVELATASTIASSSGVAAQ